MVSSPRVWILQRLALIGQTRLQKHEKLPQRVHLVQSCNNMQGSQNDASALFLTLYVYHHYGIAMARVV